MLPKYARLLLMLVASRLLKKTGSADHSSSSVPLLNVVMHTTTHTTLNLDRILTLTLTWTLYSEKYV